MRRTAVRRTIRPVWRRLLAVVLGVASTTVAAGVPDAAPGQATETTVLTIADAVSRALEVNFRVARAGRSQQIAELRERSAAAARRPRASIGLGLNQAARGTFQATPTFTREQELAGDFRTGINVAAQMPIDVSGALRRQTTQAELGSRLAALDVLQSKADVGFEVSTAYLAAWRTREVAAIDSAAAASIERLVRQADAASLPFLDVELSAARQVLEASRAAADTAEDVLRYWLRFPPGRPLQLASPVAGPDVEAIPSGGAGRRPDIEQARVRVAQAEVGIKQATDGRRPSMTLNAYYNQAWTGETALRPGDGRTRDQGGVIALNVPLYSVDWGQSASARRIARIQADQARADLREQQERADYDLRQAYAALDRARSRIRALPGDAPASVALRQAEQAFVTGDGDDRSALLAQVSNARAAWRQARLNALSAHHDKALAMLRVKRALGEALVGPAGDDG